MIFIRVMYSSKPARGKGVDSCQFRGVWRCLVQLGSSTVKDCRAGAANPFPWTLSPFLQPARQQTGWKVPFNHGDGTPFSASKLLSRFEGVRPWTGKSFPYPKSRLKPTAAFQALPGNPAIDTHTCPHFDIKKCLPLFSCMHQPSSNRNFT